MRGTENGGESRERRESPARANRSACATGDVVENAEPHGKRVAGRRGEAGDRARGFGAGLSVGAR